MQVYLNQFGSGILITCSNILVVVRLFLKPPCTLCHIVNTTADWEVLTGCLGDYWLTTMDYIRQYICLEASKNNFSVTHFNISL